MYHTSLSNNCSWSQVPSFLSLNCFLEYLGVALVSLELQHLDLTASIKHLQELVDIMLTD